MNKHDNNITPLKLTNTRPTRQQTDDISITTTSNRQHIINFPFINNIIMNQQRHYVNLHPIHTNKANITQSIEEISGRIKRVSIEIVLAASRRKPVSPRPEGTLMAHKKHWTRVDRFTVAHLCLRSHVSRESGDVACVARTAFWTRREVHFECIPYWFSLFIVNEVFYRMECFRDFVKFCFKHFFRIIIIIRNLKRISIKNIIFEFDYTKVLRSLILRSRGRYSEGGPDWNVFGPLRAETLSTIFLPQV